MVVPSISTAHPENRPPQMPDLSSQHSLPQPAPLAADFATSQTVVITQPGDSIQPAAECAFRPAVDASEMPEDDELELQENVPDIPAKATQYLPKPQGEITLTVDSDVQETAVTGLELDIAAPVCLSSEEREALRRSRRLKAEIVHLSSQLSAAATLIATASDEDELEREWQHQMCMDGLEFERQCQEHQEQQEYRSAAAHSMLFAGESTWGECVQQEQQQPVDKCFRTADYPSNTETEQRAESENMPEACTGERVMNSAGVNQPDKPGHSPLIPIEYNDINDDNIQSLAPYIDAAREH